MVSVHAAPRVSESASLPPGSVVMAVAKDGEHLDARKVLVDLI